MYVCMCIYIYIYVERERERDHIIYDICICINHKALTTAQSPPEVRGSSPGTRQHQDRGQDPYLKVEIRRR